MRIFILTSQQYGLASLALEPVCRIEGIKIASVIFNEQTGNHHAKKLRRKFKKVLRIGPFGAINGLRMRSWYTSDIQKILNIPRLDKTAHYLGIPFRKVPSINCSLTCRLLTEIDADLGISLGNPYIAEKVFTIPKRGMINIHHEQLPEFQGAQSIIWQIYKKSSVTGYTIHEINSRIDTGDILYQETIPIEFKPRLSQTVSFNYARLLTASMKGLVQVLGDYREYQDKASCQQHGHKFTTPGILQYLKILHNHRKLSKQYRPEYRINPQDENLR